MPPLHVPVVWLGGAVELVWVGVLDVVLVAPAVVFEVVDEGELPAVVVGVDPPPVAVPKEGFAWQVVTCRPAVSEARPSGPSGSEKPSGTVPTYALKL